MVLDLRFVRDSGTHYELLYLRCTVTLSSELSLGTIQTATCKSSVSPTVSDLKARFIRRNFYGLCHYFFSSLLSSNYADTYIPQIMPWKNYGAENHQIILYSAFLWGSINGNA